MSVSVSRFENDPVESNCYIIIDDLTGHLLLVDPGTKDMSAILNNVNGFLIDKIILTHEHFDHCAGCNYIFERYKTPILCSDYCAEAVRDKKKNLSVFYDQIGFEIINNIEIIQKYGAPYEWHGNAITFWHTEGHSKGSICFLIDKYIFSGDTLIENLKTVTKLKTGSKAKLNDSIRLIETIKGNGFLVCAGHGCVFELDVYDLNKAL